ncbi:C-C motif chemokine 28 [Labeo rohita]|uniref:C-C motif chemokine n=1 Tax=Labeo rohita TaxID=84645 RepID=A0ABQ8M0M3_LABRO|nr:C-C motif chemokine 27a [Labeo rohita]KAI2656469.1 C-C motif chemokine 28 [Labeo rohita]
MGFKATYLVLLMCVAIILTSTKDQNHSRSNPDIFCPNAPLQMWTYPSRKGPRRDTCCRTVLEKIPRRILRLVTSCEMQRNYGACPIRALILHIRNRPICAHPRMLKKLKKIHETGLNANRK